MEKKVLKVNGVPKTVIANPEASLADVLREQLGITGVKVGCGTAHCGCCSVIMDGKLTKACVTKMSKVEDGAMVTTVEGIGGTAIGRAVQDAWVALNVPQCGYCQSGQVMAAAALLSARPLPDDDDIDAAMSGNICRCGTYPRIFAAAREAAGTKMADNVDVVPYDAI